MSRHHHQQLSTPSDDLLLAIQRTQSTFEQIPIIDLGDANSSDPLVRRALADQIRDACVNVGFFYAKNHGIPDAIINAAVDAGKQFFSLPDDEKIELDIRKTPNFRGYTALLQENTNPAGNGDLHEGFDIGWEPDLLDNLSEVEPYANMYGANVWPKEWPEFKAAVMEYYNAAVQFGKILFPLFALALCLPDDFFADKTTKPAAIMRILHYPPQHPASADSKQMGIGAHTDYECFTLLWQDKVGGLQIQNADGKWVDAVHIPGTLVVNLGDQFARWTNDVFKSTLHRAINTSGAERYSMPLFFGTDYDVKLEPIPTCISPDSPPKYEIVTAGEYVKSRLEATYVKEVQHVDSIK